MSFQSIWGFDPDELIKTKELTNEANVEEFDHDPVERPPCMPVDIEAQKYELRRMPAL